MGETSFAKKFISGQGQEPNEDRPWRNGFGSDNAGGPNSFCLSLRSKDGRKSEGPSMSLFLWHYWIDDGGPTEKLVLLFNIGGEFGICGIFIEGLHMKRQVRALLEEGKLKYIQQHDSLEVEAIRAHNLDTRKAEEKEPVVLRILIRPDMETRLKSEKHLAAIADAMKGEEGETGDAGTPE